MHEEAALKKELWAYTDANYLDVVYLSTALSLNTSSVCRDAQIACLGGDRADAGVVEALHKAGVRMLVLRCADARGVDVEKAGGLGMAVTMTPMHEYTGMAEYAVGLMMTVNRKIHLAYNRVREGNLSLNGMVGFEMMGKTVGIIGTSKVGMMVARIVKGFGCEVVAYDTVRNESLEGVGGCYASVAELLSQSDIVSLHAPLVSGTHHMLRMETLQMCKKGVYIINISGSGLIDSKAAIELLRNGHIGGLAMDVPEGCNGGESEDTDVEMLKSMGNVLMTAQQSGLTGSGVEKMAKVCSKSMVQYLRGEGLQYKYRGGW